MEIAYNSVSVSRVPREKEPGYTIGTFTEAMQKEILKSYHAKYPPSHPSGPPATGFEKYVAPEGYRDSYDHFQNFFAAVRSRKPVVEDASLRLPRRRSRLAQQSEHRARRSREVGSRRDEVAIGDFSP